MTTYTVQGPSHSGAQLTTAAPGGTAGDLAVTGQGIALLVQNAGTASITVTLPVAPTYDGLTVTSRTVVCAASSGSVDGLTVIPLPDSVYGVGTTAVAYSSVTSITVAQVRIP